MKKLIPWRLAVYGTLIIMSAFLVFHVLVMSGVIPFDIVWGGRLETREQMLEAETISVMINLFLVTAVAIRGGLLKLRINPQYLQIVMWLMVILFAINTVGNLFSNNNFEKAAFTPVTVVLAIFCWRLALEEGSKA
jgi:hypothetical protein